MHGFVNISCEIYGFPAGNTRAPAGKITPWAGVFFFFFLCALLFTNFGYIQEADFVWALIF